MKYEISNMGKSTGVIRLAANKFTYWIFSLQKTLLGVQQAENDAAPLDYSFRHPKLDLGSSTSKLIHEVDYKITHISYSIFHISNTTGEIIK